jgi:hypothetical protein
METGMFAETLENLQHAARRIPESQRHTLQYNAEVGARLTNRYFK